MSRVEELEDRIQPLSANELQELRAWFAQREAEIWDRQFEEDALSGRPDALADAALSDLAQGRSTEL